MLDETGKRDGPADPTRRSLGAGILGLGALAAGTVVPSGVEAQNLKTPLEIARGYAGYSLSILPHSQKIEREWSSIDPLRRLEGPATGDSVSLSGNDRKTAESLLARIQELSADNKKILRDIDRQIQTWETQTGRTIDSETERPNPDPAAEVFLGVRIAVNASEERFGALWRDIGAALDRK